MFFNPVYFLFLLPAVLLAVWAQRRVASTYREASRIPAASGYSGAEAADALLRSADIHQVAIAEVPGQLTDHYSPGEKVLSLSPEAHDDRSLAGVGRAAHEAAHVLQDADEYPMLGFRNAVVPLANIGSTFGWVMIVLGLALQVAGLIYVGIAVFSLTVLAQVVNLPAEFDASRRARARLLETGLVSPAEEKEVGRVLTAAALTHLAATLFGALGYVLHRTRALRRSW
jgi:Zn-dependent membrane protease YugP